MISSIEGIVTEIHEDHIVLLIGGIGLKVFTAGEFNQRIELHKTLGLATHLVVREDSLTLFGFESLEQRDIFIQLLSVSGVGPRSGMAIVSIVPIEKIKEAVINENPELLGGIPGVGKKTAQSIILHLHGKIKGESGYSGREVSDIDRDVIAALTGLGYSLVEAQSASQAIPRDAPDDLEARIKIALRSF